MKAQKDIYLFVGPPGSGKGTLSHRCCKEFDWKQISTGDLCRRHLAEGTEIGKQIDFAVKSGKLVSDMLIVSMVKDWLETSIDGVSAVVLDGVPRTVAQAKALQELVQIDLTNVKLYVVRLCIDDSAIIRRLCDRCICQNKSCQAVYSVTPGALLAPKKPMICDKCSSPLGHRKDDAEETVRERLKIYHKHEDDLIRFYRDQGQMINELHVDKPVEGIFSNFKRLMELNR